MDILRIIKLKDVLGELENITSQEKLFFELHENLHKDERGMLCDDKNLWLVYYDLKKNHFWYHHDRFYLFFKQKFDINIQDFNDLCKSILEKHLNCKQLTPKYTSTRKQLHIGEAFKL